MVFAHVCRFLLFLKHFANFKVAVLEPTTCLIHCLGRALSFDFGEQDGHGPSHGGGHAPLRPRILRQPPGFTALAAKLSNMHRVDFNIMTYVGTAVSKIGKENCWNEYDFFQSLTKVIVSNQQSCFTIIGVSSLEW